MRALDRLAEAVGADDARFKFRLIPKSTLERRRESSSKRLTCEEGNRLARLAKVFSFALNIYKEPANAREFLARAGAPVARWLRRHSSGWSPRAGADAHVLYKNAREMALVRKARRRSDLRERLTPVFHQRLGRFNPMAEQPAMRRQPRRPTESSREVADREFALGRDFLQRALPVEVGRKPFAGAAQLPGREPALWNILDEAHPAVGLCDMRGEGQDEMIDEELVRLFRPPQGGPSRVAEVAQHLVLISVPEIVVQFADR